ncbi:putative bifunctional diguanylate cyclase/phosphodiesterase [Ferrimonas senticii]|uniref:putative bifunctional diguanylate cyclase/phosphodiesterase n=1 Tax=Ferrimonas senticii TaxID=394566 RepID=UPI00042A5B3F|nr:EAL domain-containing protein [Ferrimonas senticii]
MIKPPKFNIGAKLLALGTLVTAYLVGLFLFVIEGHQQLRSHQNSQFDVRIQQYGRELSYLLDSSALALADLVQDKAIYGYLSNRALGMSMSYGLGTSLHKVNLLLQQRQRMQIGDRQAYQRLALLDLNGQVLADTGGASEELQRLNLAALLVKPRGSSYLQVIPGETQPQLLQLMLVYHYDQPHAVLVAQLDQRTLQRLLTRFEALSKHSRVTLTTPAGDLLAWNSLPSDQLHKSELLYQVQQPVAGAPLTVKGWFEPLTEQQLLTSRRFMIATGVFGVAVLGSFLFVLWGYNRHLRLQAKIARSANQRLELKQKNQELELEVARRKDTELRLEHQANNDGLTGLANRYSGQRALTAALTEAAAAEESVLLMMLDLDNFKDINDTQGHAAGDQLLCECARRLAALQTPHSTLARFGGDEFFWVVPQLAQVEQATELAQSLLELFERPFILNGNEFFVSASVGMAFYPADGDSGEQLFQRADEALYRAKERGRNGFCFYDAELGLKLRRKMLLQSKLRNALANQRISVFYQPIIDLTSQQVIGAEALARWHDPELGFISPLEFIDIAERNGMVAELGKQVLMQACDQAKRWQQLAPLTVSVNVSSVQFQQFNILLSHIYQALEHSELPAQQLVLEATESLLLSNHAAFAQQLSVLTEMGIQLAIDDFGTGYCGLSYLHRFPFSILKIDRSFIPKQISQQGEQAALVHAILAMAKALDLKVVAEGVEHSWQAEYLQQHGCQRAQGFYYGEPMSAEDFWQFLQLRVKRQKLLQPTVVALRAR